MGPFVASGGAGRQPGCSDAPSNRRDAIDVDAYQLFRRGSELLAAGRAHQAVISLEQARDLAPRHGSVREALGRAYYGASRTSAAEAEFAEALEIDPSNDYAHFGLGLCLARGGEPVRALGHLRLAVVMRPEVDTYRRALDRVERQQAGAHTAGAGEAGGGVGPGSHGSVVAAEGNRRRSGPLMGVAEGGALAGGFRGVVFDLDGVVYLGEVAVPAAPAALDRVRGLGVRVAFVTNNSYRPPDLVAEKLRRLGIKAEPGEVLTSAQAAVRLLGGREGLEGVSVLVVGGPGLRQALEAAGARLVDGSSWRDAEVVAVGFDPELTYARVRDATLAIRAGARFVGSNPDTTLPTPEGLWPGAGATLALLQASTGVRPEVAGKPERALLETAAAAIGPGPYLMVGDRPDTDLDGAQRLGWATALVLSGVTRPVDLPDLAVAPDHLLADVGGLLDPPGPAIRPAAAAEQDAVARLLASAGGTGPEPGDRVAGEGGAGPATPDGGAGWVALDGERVVGAVALRRAGALGLVEGPVVEEGWRGRLVGTRLMVAACVEARAAGMARVAAAADAGAFLRRLGFHPAGAGDPALAAAAGGAEDGPPATRPLVRDLAPAPGQWAS